MNRSADFWSGDVASLRSRPLAIGGSAPSRSFERILLLLLTVGFFYNAYRYPLQINNSGTSPTYADTPAWLSLGKYVLIAVVLVLAILFRIAQRRNPVVQHPLHLLGYLFLALIPVAAGLLSGMVEYAIIGFFFMVPAVLQFYSGAALDFKRMNRYLAAVMWIAIAVDLLQVALFVTVGRLPALAYEDSLSVRFGSFLDDPNGFGIVICWLLPFSIFHYRGWIRALVVVTLAIMLVLTQSLTALACFGIAGLMTIAIIVSTKPRLVLPALIAGLSLGIGIGAVLYSYWREVRLLYDLFMLTKEGSISAHAGAFGVIERLRALNIAGLEPEVRIWVETGYLNLLAHFGLIYVLVLIYLGLWTLVHYMRRAGDSSLAPELRTFAAGAAGLMAAFLLGNLNLPLVEVYPVNLFAAVAMGMASAGAINAARRYPTRTSAVALG